MLDEEFCTELFSSLFLPEIPVKTLMRIEKQWSTLSAPIPGSDRLSTSLHGATSNEYQNGHNPAFYFPLFKRPVHINKMTVAELVMINHTSTER